MDTYFASSERSSKEEIISEIKIVTENPVMSGILHSISGLLAILDENRQILAVNDSFLQMLGINNPAKTLGLRPGEVLKCVHASDKPAGCGTTKYCNTCGAAIAIVSSLGQNKKYDERICAITAKRGGNLIDIALLVRSHQIKIGKKKFLLLILQDITQQQQRAALERTFFHDINNMLGLLLGASELLVEENQSKLANTIHQSTVRLSREIAIQRCLSQSGSANYQPVWHKYSTDQIINEIKSFFINHPIVLDKKIEYANNYPQLIIKTDISLFLRIISNMIINALEATGLNGTVKLWLVKKNDHLLFNVWNNCLIPEQVANRIFQRNFSTKNQAGRGIGTYSMKLFGEKILGGKVTFTSSIDKGTIFVFNVPI